MEPLVYCIKTRYKLDGSKIKHPPIAKKETALYVLGKRQKQKEIDDGRKIALQKQKKIRFIGL